MLIKKLINIFAKNNIMELKLKIFKEIKKRGLSRALLMPDGKLYFNKTSIGEFGLSENVYLKIASNENDENDKNIYLIKLKEKEDYSIRISKSGYLNSKNFFSKLAINCKKYSYSYSIEKGEYEKNELLILKNQGERERKKRNEDKNKEQ